MNYQWGYQEQSFPIRGSQQCFVSNFQECLDIRKFNTRTYVNPHVANYEYIKRSLIKTPSSGSSKIHVNPNFKGNQEKNYLNLNNLNYLSNSHSGRPDDLSQQGSSNTSSVCNKKINLNTCNTDLEVTLLKSRFKKINKRNSEKPKYFWSEGENIKELPKSNGLLFLKSAKNCKKPIADDFGSSKYKFVASKKSKIQTPEKTFSRIFLSKTKIINKSKTKLVNNNTKIERKIIKISPPIKTPFYKLENKNKKLVILKVAKAVTNKYKYYNNFKQFRSSKYKIDKRNKGETLKREDKGHLSETDISKLFPNNFHSKLKPFQQRSIIGSHKIMCLQRKNQLPQQINLGMAKKFANKRVVKIGGILYKTTTNKLTLAKNKELKKQSKSKNHFVYVRGEKFLLENNGKTLRRQPQNKAGERNTLLTLKRIDIGGVTYIHKSKNVLVRTNVHRAQYLLNKARNKSIAILTNLRKRSTMPCMIYHRFGKCNRHNKNLCMYKHDPKNIAICKMFLKGDCKNSNCLLSHQAIPEKMATCHFFLNGFCDRDNCLFPHVKLNNNAAICEKFLQGFCNEGKECLKRHIHLCPNFDKFGKCSLGSKCHYPHKVRSKKLRVSENIQEANGNKKIQYFIKSVENEQSKRKLKGCLAKEENKKGAKKKLKIESMSLDNTPTNQSCATIKCVPERIKLDKLPCYIPLQKDA